MTGIRRFVYAIVLAIILVAPFGLNVIRHTAPAATIAQLGGLYFDECKENTCG
ncbi:MAG: hypothetical protein GXP42_18495 [Chloroflexi bacterium]|nr:hypothetical protein [Chloroflexota bacterium]